MIPALAPTARFSGRAVWRLARTDSGPLVTLVPLADLPDLMAFLEVTTGLTEDPLAVSKPFLARGGPSRFSDGSFGVFYAGLDLPTCLAEVRFHQALYLEQSQAPPGNIHFRALRAQVTGSLLDVRKGHPELHQASRDYSVPAAFGLSARIAGADGVFYTSVRQQDGECVAVFRPACITKCQSGTALVALHWDGQVLQALV